MSGLADIREKVASGVRLTEADALRLFEYPDLEAVGALANTVNIAKNRNHVFYNINRHINPTNICVLSCKFCAYSRKPGEEGAYSYSIDEMLVKAREAAEQGATELHMVGGLHPRWKFAHYREMIQAIKQAFPHIHLKAFTVVELDWMSKKERRPIRDLLIDLREAGLGSLPGGGAEIFHPEIRDRICDTKVSADLWLDTHKTAHSLGMHSNATMLYGHIETFAHRVDHMARLRALQDETKGFNAFIPLSFQPHHNEMGIERYTYGFDDLKTIAVARLFLDNFRHVKAYWIMLGQDIAQLALHYGANDLDGTVIEEKISRMAGGRAGMGVTRQFLERTIRRARREPIERDTLYRPVGVLPENEAMVPVSSLQELLEVAWASGPVQEVANAVESADVHDLAALATRERENGSGRYDPYTDAGVAFVREEVFTRESASDTVHGSEAPAEINASLVTQVDLHRLCENEQVDAGALIEWLWSLKQKGAHTLSLRGLKALWAMAQDSGVEIADLLLRLKEAGVDFIMSSPLESETDLTNSEYSAILRQIHLHDVQTVVKVELAGSKTGPLLWESFIKRLREIESVSRETFSVFGIEVEAAPNSFVTPHDYMRAVAVARLVAPSVPHIIAPLPRLPTLGADAASINGKKQFVTQKTAPLALLYGASHLGFLDVSSIKPATVFDEIRAAGFKPCLLTPDMPTSPVAADASGCSTHIPRVRERVGERINPTSGERQTEL